MCRVCRQWQRELLCEACLDLAELGQARCPRCGLRHASHTPRSEACARCEDWPPTFDHTITALDYVAPWSALIAALKFRQDPALAGFLGEMLAGEVARRWAQPASRGVVLRKGAPTVVVPVPLSAERLRERGYNQAWLLARAVAAPWRLPVIADALIRQRDTTRLMSLDADQRAEHIQGAFTVNPAWQARLTGRHVAVVDDVLTTGATLQEVASTLWQAGAREVSVWVVARTPPPEQGPERADRPLRLDPRAPWLGAAAPAR